MGTWRSIDFCSVSARTTSLEALACSPVAVDAPLQARRSQGGNPLPGQRQVCRFVEVPGVAHATGGLNVEPQTLHDDLVVRDHLEEFVELCLNGLAGRATLDPGT